MRTALLLSLFPLLSAAAQCDLLIKEDFRLGDRPNGNRGRIRTAQIHDGLGDYWTQVPGDASVSWISGEPPSFQFAASSVDPLEWPEDPAFPEFNGTAFGEHHGASVVPFALPAARFVAGFDAVPIYGFHDGILFGLTNSTTGLGNFAAGGELWVRYAGDGEWELHTRTQGLIASGIASTGSLLTGFTPVQLEYTPGARRLRLAINHEIVADTTLAAEPAATHLAFECDAPFTNWQVVNNLAVRRGGLSLLDADPADVSAAPGAAFTLTAASALTQRKVMWLFNGLPLSEGPQAIGVVSGADALTLTVADATPAAAGLYRCLIVSPCGSWTSAPAAVTINVGCPADFNADGFLDFFDYDDFVACYETGACPPGALGGADFNKDGFADFFDYDDFVAAYEAGC